MQKYCHIYDDSKESAIKQACTYCRGKNKAKDCEIIYLTIYESVKATKVRQKGGKPDKITLTGIKVVDGWL